MEYQKSAGLIVYYLKENKPYFLLLKYPSYWGFTKGLLEKDEDEKKAALREAEEETGLKDFEIIPGFEEKQTFFFRFKGKTIKKEATFFLAKTSEKEAENTKISWEHGDFIWLPLEEAIAKTRVKPNKEMLKKANEFILAFDKQKRLV